MDWPYEHPCLTEPEDLAWDSYVDGYVQSAFDLSSCKESLDSPDAEDLDQFPLPEDWKDSCLLQWDSFTPWYLALTTSIATGTCETDLQPQEIKNTSSIHLVSKLSDASFVSCHTFWTADEEGIKFAVSEGLLQKLSAKARDVLLNLWGTPHSKEDSTRDDVTKRNSVSDKTGSSTDWCETWLFNDAPKDSKTDPCLPTNAARSYDAIETRIFVQTAVSSRESASESSVGTSGSESDYSTAPTSKLSDSTFGTAPSCHSVVMPFICTDAVGDAHQHPLCNEVQLLCPWCTMHYYQFTANGGLEAEEGSPISSLGVDASLVSETGGWSDYLTDSIFMAEDYEAAETERDEDIKHTKEFLDLQSTVLVKSICSTFEIFQEAVEDALPSKGGTVAMCCMRTETQYIDEKDGGLEKQQRYPGVSREDDTESSHVWTRELAESITTDTTEQLRKQQLNCSFEEQHPASSQESLQVWAGKFVKAAIEQAKEDWLNRVKPREEIIESVQDRAGKLVEIALEEAMEQLKKQKWHCFVENSRKTDVVVPAQNSSTEFCSSTHQEDSSALTSFAVHFAHTCIQRAIESIKSGATFLGDELGEEEESSSVKKTLGKDLNSSHSVAAHKPASDTAIKAKDLDELPMPNETISLPEQHDSRAIAKREERTVHMLAQQTADSATINAIQKYQHPFSPGGKELIQRDTRMGNQLTKGNQQQVREALHPLNESLRSAAFELVITSVQKALDSLNVARPVHTKDGVPPNISEKHTMVEKLDLKTTATGERQPVGIDKETAFDKKYQIQHSSSSERKEPIQHGNNMGSQRAAGNQNQVKGILHSVNESLRSAAFELVSASVQKAIDSLKQNVDSKDPVSLKISGNKQSKYRAIAERLDLHPTREWKPTLSPQRIAEDPRPVEILPEPSSKVGESLPTNVSLRKSGQGHFTGKHADCPQCQRIMEIAKESEELLKLRASEAKKKDDHQGSNIGQLKPSGVGKEHMHKPAQLGYKPDPHQFLPKVGTGARLSTKHGSHSDRRVIDLQRRNVAEKSQLKSPTTNNAIDSSWDSVRKKEIHASSNQIDSISSLWKHSKPTKISTKQPVETGFKECYTGEEVDKSHSEKVTRLKHLRKSPLIPTAMLASKPSEDEMEEAKPKFFQEEAEVQENEGICSARFKIDEGDTSFDPQNFTAVKPPEGLRDFARPKPVRYFQRQDSSSSSQLSQHFPSQGTQKSSLSPGGMGPLACMRSPSIKERPIYPKDTVSSSAGTDHDGRENAVTSSEEPLFVNALQFFKSMEKSSPVPDKANKNQTQVEQTQTTEGPRYRQNISVDGRDGAPAEMILEPLEVERSLLGSSSETRTRFRTSGVTSSNPREIIKLKQKWRVAQALPKPKETVLDSGAVELQPGPDDHGGQLKKIASGETTVRVYPSFDQKLKLWQEMDISKTSSLLEALPGEDIHDDAYNTNQMQSNEPQTSSCSEKIDHQQRPAGPLFNHGQRDTFSIRQYSCGLETQKNKSGGGQSQ